MNAALWFLQYEKSIFYKILILKNICLIIKLKNEITTFFLQSGTVGNPKAVMLSHDNFLSNVRSMSMALELKEGYETLVSYLPLSHVAAQVNINL